MDFLYAWYFLILYILLDSFFNKYFFENVNLFYFFLYAYAFFVLLKVGDKNKLEVWKAKRTNYWKTFHESPWKCGNESNYWNLSLILTKKTFDFITVTEFCCQEDPQRQFSRGSRLFQTIYTGWNCAPMSDFYEYGHFVVKLQ